MNDQQSNGEIRFEEIMLETAWEEVETVFRASGQVAPLPGFTSRFMERLELARQREERLQATALIISNLVIALGFIILISLQFVPSISSGGLLELWVGLITRLVVFVKMVSGVLSTFFRTIPALVPTSWLVSGFTLMGLVVVLWISMVRRHIRVQGARHD
ncbi:MAG: hypothetical protein JW757_00785 [Anaerolineales bacterium]|nr:hypothetical protein [Anaerolineales bacterium]